MNSKHDYVRPDSVVVSYTLLRSVASAASKMDASYARLPYRGLFSLVNWGESQRCNFEDEDYPEDVIHLPLVPFLTTMGDCLDEYQALAKSEWKQCGQFSFAGCTSIANPNDVALALNEVFSRTGLHYAGAAYSPDKGWYDSVAMHRYHSESSRAAAEDYPFNLWSDATRAAFESNEDNTVLISKAASCDMRSCLFNHGSRQDWHFNVSELRLNPCLDLIESAPKVVSAPFVWLNVGRIIGRNDAHRVLANWKGVLQATASRLKSEDASAFVNGTISSAIELMLTDFAGTDLSEVLEPNHWYELVSRLENSLTHPSKRSSTKYLLIGKFPRVLNARAGAEWILAVDNALNDICASDRPHLTLAYDRLTREVAGNLFFLKATLLMTVGYVYGQAEALMNERRLVGCRNN